MKDKKIIASMLPLNIQLFAEDGADEKGSDQSKQDDQNKGGTGSNNDTKSKEPEKKYTDDDVNRISKANEDKAVKKIMKDLGIEDVEEAKNILTNARAEKEKNKTAEDKTNDLNSAMADKDRKIADKNNKLASALIGNELIRQGVDMTKLERASKLIPATSVLNEDGDVDDDLMKKEIEKLLKDFPEFKTKSDTDTNNKNFKFGSDGKESDGKNSKSDVSSKKRWNRFNS